MKSGAGLTTTRYGLALAPGGLFFVQELVNGGLARGGHHDPLSSIDEANAWLSTMFDEWSTRTPAPASCLELDETGLIELRAFRTLLHGWVDGSDQQQSATTTVTVDLGPDRHIEHQRPAKTVTQFTSFVLLEMLLADHADTLQRLKTCANPNCGAVFYDESRNGSRRWHDVTTCGNQANIRAMRARRAAASTT